MVFFSKWRFWGLLGLGLLVLALLVGRATPFHALSQATLASQLVPAGKQARPVTDKVMAAASLGQLPLYFERNEGQVDAKAKYLSRGMGYTLFLTVDEAVFSLHRHQNAGPQSFDKQPSLADVQSAVVRAHLDGANPSAPVVGEAQLPGLSNYYIGNDPARWHRGIAQYGRVRYSGVYPGVDLVYHGEQHQLEYDFVVSPGADASVIGFSYQGTDGLRIDDAGSLVISTPLGDMVQHPPVAYQTIGGTRRPVAARFQLDKQAGKVSFALADYDRNQALVIDPTLIFTSVVGDASDYFSSLAADTKTGTVYITGIAYGAALPATVDTVNTTNPASPNGGAAIYVLAYIPGTGGLYATYLGGSSVAAITACYPGGTAPPCTGATTLAEVPVFDFPKGIAIDASDDAYITGGASSSNFPVSSGAVQKQNNALASNGTNAFVAELNPSGTKLLYSTYLGGSPLCYPGGITPPCSGSTALNVVLDRATGIAVDSSGNAHISGASNSGNFPVTIGAVQTENNALASGGFNAFVSELNTGGTQLLYSTYLGGSTFDEANAVAVDSTGNTYVAGVTASSHFPVLNAYQAQYNGGSISSSSSSSSSGGSSSSGATSLNAFVTKLGTSGLIWSTYLGGSGNGAAAGDQAQGIAVDSSGNVYVVGEASSKPFVVGSGSNTSGFPVTPGAFQTTNNAAASEGFNAFVSEFDTTGQNLVYSTYVGGSGVGQGTGDDAAAIALDTAGNAYVTGAAQSKDLPLVHAFQTTNNSKIAGGSNAFVFELAPPTGSPATQSLVYSTYLGGSGVDFADAIAMYSQGYAVVAGGTSSSDFPLTSTSNGTGSFPFLALLSAEAPPSVGLVIVAGDVTSSSSSSSSSSGGSSSSGSSSSSSSGSSSGGGTSLTVAQGQPVSLVWAATNASSCLASGAWSGTQTSSSVYVFTPVTVGTNVTYTLTCSGEDGVGTGSVLLTVTPGVPTGQISVSPASISLGGSSALSWSSLYATSCTVSGSGVSGGSGLSGTIEVTPTASGNLPYTLTCMGGPGGADTVTQTATLAVGQAQPSVTITVSPSSIDLGSASGPHTATLTWSSTDVSSCTASGAWSGAQPTSNSGGMTITPTAGGVEQFNLGCTGHDGTVGGTALLTVTAPAAAPAPSSSKGGSLGLDLLGLFGLMTLLRRRSVA